MAQNHDPIVTMPPHSRWLKIALGASILVHALIFSLHFSFPTASKTFRDKALDVILVNSKSAHRPTNAQALAQANLDGGGNVDDNRRAATPLAAAEKTADGTALQQAQKRIQALEASQRLLAKKQSQAKAALDNEQKKQTEKTDALSGTDLANNALAMMRLQGEIAKNTEEYNSRPRVKFLGTRAAEYRFAQYTEDWRLKIERVGTLNYPEAARGKLYGNLMLSVRIKSNGELDRVEITRSSGHKVLDDAAKRIVQMASPFAAYPANIRHDTDIIDITRVWSFTKGNHLETSR